MKILRLDLLAFGPFTDISLDFGPTGEGVQLIYGPNGAGKSSALRALIALLYGIPIHTQDAYVHEMQELRIGACLQDGGGVTLEVIRRKGRKNTLVDPSGKPLEERLLLRLLDGVGEELFTTMFALDHTRLREGGQKLVEGDSTLAESLFGAGLGRGVHEVLSTLREEAEAIYTARGRRRALNEALSRYGEAKKDSRMLTLRPEDWEKAERELREITAEGEQCAHELRELGKERAKLERYQKLLPLLNRYDLLYRERKEMGDVVLLPLGAKQERKDGQRVLTDAGPREERLHREIAALGKEREALQVPENLLARSEALKDIEERLGAHNKAARDLTNLKAELRIYRENATTALRRLGREPDLQRADEVVVEATRQARIRNLAAQRQVLVERRESAAKSWREMDARLHKKRAGFAALAAPRDTTPLEEVLKRVRMHANLGERVAEAETEIQVRREGAETALAALGLWSGPLKDADKLPLPPEETLPRFEKFWDKAEGVRGKLDDGDERLREEAVQCAVQLEELRRQGEVPTEAELKVVRERRDRGWKLVRRAWLEDADISGEAEEFDAARPLPEAYEHSVARADAIADSLRQEADRAAQLTQLLAQKERCEKEQQELARKREKLGEREERNEREWRALWASAGIEPLPPAEMRAWIGRHARVVEKIEGLRGAERERDALQELAERNRRELSDALARLGEAPAADKEDLVALLERAEHIVRKARETVEERKRLEGEIDELNEELERLQGEEKEAVAALEKWREYWQEAIAGLGLPENSGPEEAEAFLEQEALLSQSLEWVRSHEKRISGVERDARKFAEDIEALARDCASDLGERSVEAVASELLARYQQGQVDRAERNRIDQQLEDKRRELTELEEQKAVVRARLKELMHAARCQEPAELEAAEEASAKARQLDDQLVNLKSQIVDLGARATIENLREETRHVEVAALPDQIDGLKGRIDNLTERRREIDQEIGSQRTELKAMDRGPEASEAAARAQEELARIRALVEQYARCRLAAHLLEHEMDRYREAHQGPLLERASELFEHLTLGLFARLKVDYDAKDRPVLRCVRNDGRQVSPEHLSDGEADQLYLVLRLASLERHLKTNEPIPFIVDDALVNFDDEHARAGFEVLGEFAEQTQVLFFTHHSRLRELAQQALPSNRLKERELQGPVA